MSDSLQSHVCVREGLRPLLAGPVDRRCRQGFTMVTTGNRGTATTIELPDEIKARIAAVIEGTGTSAHASNSSKASTT